MVTFDTEAVAVWDKISSLFVTSRAPCLTNFSADGSIAVTFPLSPRAMCQWKLRLAESFRLLRLDPETTPKSLVEMLLQPTGLDDLWYSQTASAAFGDPSAAARLVRLAELEATEDEVRLLLATEPVRPDQIRHARSVALLLQRLSVRNVVYAEEFSCDEGFEAAVLIESQGSSETDFLIEFRESRLDFVDLPAADSQWADYADCARIRGFLRRITHLVGRDNIRCIMK
jgi:hypothetical protein